VWEREKEREKEKGREREREGEKKKWVRESVCLYVWECVCVRMCVSECVYVVCVREWESEREAERQRERENEWEKVRVWEKNYFSNDFFVEWGNGGDSSKGDKN
jgi:hypothetical protein